MANSPGPLGWIEPNDRTSEQNAGHTDALSKMINFALPDPSGGSPVKVMLTDFWKDPDVIADVGYEFTGFHQLTGSCVGASEGNGLFTLGAVQRKLSDNPTVAFVPWWLFPYGRTRYNEGDRGQGEGAVDSIMGQTLIKEGVFSANEQGLPQFSKDDGLYLTNSLEMQWSDGGSATVTKWASVAKQFPLGSCASIYDTASIKAAVLNGYPVLDGCSYYVGTGHIASGGGSSYVVGKYDGRGGHSTCILGYWDHPNDGPLYLYSNQWPTSTYPKDPAGAGRCCVWLPEVEMAKLFKNGGGNGETMVMSHLSYLPAQPKVLDWSTI